jgi:hypothetical protein
MTCIVGIVDGDGIVHIAGDSAGVSGYDLFLRADEKVFLNGEFAMGFTTSYRMGQLLRYKLKPPEHDGAPLLEYMVTAFVDAVRDCLKQGGFAKKDKESEEGGEFIVGFKGKLFTIGSDYQVEEATVNFAACGCARSVALGALFATASTPFHLSTEKRLFLALEAAEHFSTAVRRPFHAVSVKPQPLDRRVFVYPDSPNEPGR